MEKSLIIHGRQPALGRAELESLYGSSKIRSVGEKVSLVDVDPCLLAFDRLGGGVKFCKVLSVLETADWRDIEKFLFQVSSGHSKRMPAGKMHLGLSSIELEVSVKQLQATALALKKNIKQTGRNVRVVPNKSLELNTAQVLHNKLIGQTGWELVFVRNGQKTIIAQTVKIQDIESYAKRDRQRPKRDSKIGMLPPKLAQIIINLAVGELPQQARQSVCDIPPENPIPLSHLKQTVLDPFCGTGVILQESLLMGYDISGSDLEPLMVDFTEENLAWLEDQYNIPIKPYSLKAGDATKQSWKGHFDIIASELYLGRPFSSIPKPDILAEEIKNCDRITAKFLKNVAIQTESGFRMCIAVPAWKTRKGFLHLKTLDKLTDLGYNRLKFVHASNEELTYHRPGQIVARELVVLERK